uniref:Uncharacterized protein n=1 Tax=Sinocyclocheilus grahami TaxID=75366 RepID=A0A672M2S8_SINGR
MLYFDFGYVTRCRGNILKCIFVYCSGEGSEEKDSGSDRILAFAVSVSGKHAALTDDHKRLVLFCTEPSWHCISTR